MYIFIDLSSCFDFPFLIRLDFSLKCTYCHSTRKNVRFFIAIPMTFTLYNQLVSHPLLLVKYETIEAPQSTIFIYANQSSAYIVSQAIKLYFKYVYLGNLRCEVKPREIPTRTLRSRIKFCHNRTQFSKYSHD